jgi:hypothetical protein
MAIFGQCVDLALKHSGLGDENLILEHKQIESLSYFNISKKNSSEVTDDLLTCYGRSHFVQSHD